MARRKAPTKAMGISAPPMDEHDDQINHMQDALSALNSAIASLEKAEHDKGGHRAKALDLAKQAREEVKAGIAFANTH